MGQFSYKAVDRGGGHVAGVVDAADRRSAVAALAQRGHFVMELVEKDQGHSAPPRAESSSSGAEATGSSGFIDCLRNGRVSSRDVLAMTSQLSTAVRAGLPLLNCLELMRKQQRKPAMRRMFEHLTKAVSGGKALSEALAEHNGVFNPLYLSMIRVGETGGILEQTSTQLAMILAREEKIKSNMKTAAAYPIFVLGLGIASAVLVVTVMLPKILGTVEMSEAMMPLPTRVLLASSHSLRALFTSAGGWVVLAALVGGLLMLHKWKKTAGRVQWDAFRLKTPVLGTVLQTIAVGRFARTLGALTKGGVTILESLAVVRDTLGNEVLARTIDEVADKVKRGEALAEPLDQSGHFPPLLVQIVAIGEQTGKLDELLLNAADTFDADADAAINRFMAIFPALLILVLALIIGFVIAAALLPIVMMSLNAGMA
ncbi:MAG: type II secretion system F family protein [Phycisphaerae bacterium]|nr:type II secretion system F family protein [Phycisphaerae bacterium]